MWEFLAPPYASRSKCLHTSKCVMQEPCRRKGQRLGHWDILGLYRINYDTNISAYRKHSLGTAVGTGALSSLVIPVCAQLHAQHT